MNPARPAVIVVTPNPAVDRTYRVSSLEPATTVRVRESVARPGGKGVNVAHVLRQFGTHVRAAQPLGGPDRQWFIRSLRRSGIELVDTRIAGRTRATVTVVDDAGAATVLAEPGPSVGDIEWHDFVATVAACANVGDWLVIAGSAPGRVGPAQFESLLAAALETGARVVVDTSGPLLAVAARLGCEVVKGNRTEAIEAAGTSALSVAMEELSGAGATVVVTLGHEGAMLRTPGGTLFHHSAARNTSGNATGAGDAATAGLVLALERGHPPQAALAWSVAFGTAAVPVPVAGHVDMAILRGFAGELTGPAGEDLVRLIDDVEGRAI